MRRAGRISLAMLNVIAKSMLVLLTVGCLIALISIGVALATGR